MSSGFAVTVKIVCHNNTPKPVQLAQEVWDLFLEDIQKVQSPDLTYTERINVVFAIIIIALFFGALCLA